MPQVLEISRNVSLALGDALHPNLLSHFLGHIYLSLWLWDSLGVSVPPPRLSHIESLKELRKERKVISVFSW